MSKVTEELTRIREILEEGQSGGGSSDFSTAQVTITNDTPILIIHPVQADVSSGLAIHNAASGVSNTAPKTFTVPLYKGKYVTEVDQVCGPIPSGITIDGELHVSLKGNASLDEYGLITITGDCELTVYVYRDEVLH